jgi:hypothetical protein
MRRTRLVVALSLLVFVVGCSSGKGNTNGSSPHRSVASTSVPTVLSDREVLRRVSWQAGDLRAPYHTVLFGGGDQVVNQVTLDLCGANFPSEQRRTARHQVGVLSGKAGAGISIEAVLYGAPAGAAQAMREVRAAKTNCPSGYEQGDVAGVRPLRYRFAPAPDTAWNKVNGVDRFVVVATLNDRQGHTEHVNAVYQQRGRLLVGFYSTDPKATSGALTRSLEAFTEVLARRMAALPATAVEKAAGSL